jgi:competence ComEA-like helix-hairpin-helix protein
VKNRIKDYFSFNKRERNGIIVLLIILVVIIAVPHIIPLFIKNKPPDFSKFQSDIAKFEQTLKEDTARKHYSYYANEFDFDNIDKSSAEEKLHPFNFNPNDITAEEWEEMGLTAKQARVIENYVAKGGKFRKKEDLKKMYCITESEYNVLEPYIQLSPDEIDNGKKKSSAYKSEKNTVVIELNSADTNDLKKLSGIGSWYAKKIVAYRNKLGGFYKKEQLLEVRGIDSTRYAGFVDFVNVNTSLVKTININTASVEELKRHPYIGNNIAVSLTNLRQLYGRFKSVADIRKSALVTDANYEKIAAYLTVE